MVEISIGLGIVLSLVLSETLGVTAGGVIVPGYIALYLNQPLQVGVTFAVAILVRGIIQVLGHIWIYIQEHDLCSTRVRERGRDREYYTWPHSELDGPAGCDKNGLGRDTDSGNCQTLCDDIIRRSEH